MYGLRTELSREKAFLSDFAELDRSISMTKSFLISLIFVTRLATAEELPDLVDRVLPGVVNISTLKMPRVPVFGMEEYLKLWGLPKDRVQNNLGTGFIIDEEGYMLTNNHVIAGADEVIVTLKDNRVLKAYLKGKDSKLDLALLQIRDGKNIPKNIKPVPMGNSEAIRIGESVFAVGNPFGLQHTVTRGIISAKNRTIGLGPYDNFLQTDTSINPGNSGGPLFNMKGEVVGINSAIFSRTGQSVGLGFAIPINAAKTYLSDLKSYGHIQRPWLGILGQRLTPQLQFYYDLPTSDGILIYNLVQRGPGERAGFQIGDILLAVDGKKVDELQDVERLLAKHKPGDSIKLHIQRGRKKMDVSMKLEEHPPKIQELPEGVL